MWQLAQLLFSTLLLWIFIASCTNKKEQKTSLAPDQSIVEVLENEDSIKSISYQKATEKGDQKLKSSTDQSIFKYDLSRPTQTSILSSELNEISALSFNIDENIIYAVNDEKGTLFSLDPSNGEIVDRMKFGKKNDYEGVSIGEPGTIYAVQSNGNIYAIQKSSGETKKIKTELRGSNDVEGLGYDRDNKMLLLACKGSPSLSKNAGKSKGVKAVYGWSTESKSLIEEPILLIQDNDLVAYFEALDLDLTKSKTKKFKKRLKDFSPSGIAFNENDNLYYLISSVGKLLITVDKNSQIQHVAFLDDTYFAQPEGICFGQDNALYISNEGRGLIAKLMRFDLK